MRSYRSISGVTGLSRSKPKGARFTIRVAAIWRKRWVRIAAAILAVPAVVLVLAATYYYISFSRLIDARLHGERSTVFPRVLARPLELRRGQSITDQQLVDRLNELGYAHRDRAEKAGEFAIGAGAVAIMPRVPELKGQIVHVIFQRPQAPRPVAKGKKAPPP